MATTYKSLVASIIQCLKQLMEKDNHTADSRESLEVSIQCLESAYGVQVSDAKESFDILSIYETQRCKNKQVEATPEAKAEAEKLKKEGNELLKTEKYLEALSNYSKAIELDNQNAVYYCNRAAVHSKLGNHHQAIKDCNTALAFDPCYSKAYGRLGLAYSNLNQYKEAKENYKKALEIEPENESLKNNLQIAEDKLIQNSNESTANDSTPLNAANMDLSSLLSNPALMNMARQMLSDPTMQSVMSNLMSGNVEQGGRMDALMEAGQQLAQQMQSANPDLIEYFRRQIGRNPNETEPSEK